MFVNQEWSPLHRHRYRSLQAWAYLASLAVLWCAWLRASPIRSTRARVGLGGITGALWLTAIGITVGHRPQPRPGESLALFAQRVDGVERALMVVLVGLLGVWLVHSLWTWRRTNLVHAAVVALVVGLSWRYVRAIPDAARLTFPVLTATVSALWARRRTSRARRERGTHAQAHERGLVLGGMAAMLGLVAYLLVTCGPRPEADRDRRTLGWGVRQSLSMGCVVRFFEHHGLTGHVFSPVGAHGSWLLFRLWPTIQVSSDGRLYAYGAALVLAGDAALREPAAMRAYLRRFPPEVMVMRHSSLSLENYGVLLHELGWRFVHLNDQVFVMAAPTPAHTALRQRESYLHILPWLNLPVTPANAPAVLAEATRALTACPEGATFGWAYKAEALRVLGRHEESQAAQRKVPAQLWIE